MALAHKEHEIGAYSKVPGWGTMSEAFPLVETTRAFFLKCRERSGQPCALRGATGRGDQRLCLSTRFIPSDTRTLSPAESCQTYQWAAITYGDVSSLAFYNKRMRRLTDHDQSSVDRGRGEEVMGRYV
jgi:hypothetical protein